LLEVKDVLKQYDGRAVVNRVSFDVRPGEIFALLGPNGAGKTTLIRMITDILKPDSGTLLLDGQPVGGARKRDVGYLPEERGLYRSDKVIDTLAYFGQLKGMKAAEAKGAAAILLDRVELSEWVQKPVQSLSKGMQQKVQLCTAMIGDPRVLILDEPFSGLDPVNVQLLEAILHERRAAGTTILLSTHQMNKVEQLCDRALMIHHGHMVLYGAVGELRRRYADHAVIVQLEDEAAAPRLAGIAGVQRVERLAGDFKLTLEAAATRRGVLRALLDEGIGLESFSHAIMPIEDVFVKVVREGLGLDHGRSAAAAPVEEVVR
jgi:ABC-2 type transport system ATP-binding protein